ncbi:MULTISPECIES: protein kilB [Streptomyces]|uniref:protein kilB n=1 Tax=Streptomyces TaxID=1883 RepID=UPI001360CDAC|nr:protein kilB [Streptomyces sp. SID724]
MLTAVIAVLGTLAGSFVTGALQLFAQRAQRAAEELAARRSEGLDAVAGLSAALADHRRAMAVREEIRLVGGDWSAARAESHATRSAVTAPLLRVRLVLPELSGAAQHAVQAAYDIRAAGDPAELQEARERALRAVEDLVVAAGAVLGA